jgi:hypothetical protein
MTGQTRGRPPQPTQATALTADTPALGAISRPSTQAKVWFIGA